MEARDFVLFAHGVNDGGISGRTALQKNVYFLSVMMGEDLGFRPHFYGPYSHLVAEANSELKTLNYLKEDVTVYGINHQGFEMARYDYTLSEDGQKLLDRKKKNNPEEWEKFLKCSNVIKSAGNLNYMEMSIAAKIFFVLTRKKGKIYIDTIKDEANNLGWSITESERDRAIDFLNKINLAYLE